MEFDDDPTHVDEVPEFEAEQDTSPHEINMLPGYEPGLIRGIELGMSRVLGQLRNALLGVGVPPHEVERIVDFVRVRSEGTERKSPARGNAKV